jgi:hypothetical protein
VRAFRPAKLFSRRQDAALYGRQGCLPLHTVSKFTDATGAARMIGPAENHRDVADQTGRTDGMVREIAPHPIEVAPENVVPPWLDAPGRQRN